MDSSLLTAPEPLHLGDPPSPGLVRSILLTLTYSDLFDYPLDMDELHRYLPAKATREELAEAVESLVPRAVCRQDGYLCLCGREPTVANRRHRAGLAQRRWDAARGFAGWLERLPFLRMVAVCGSQAVENGHEDGDVDLFLITEPGRLWLVQSLTMVLRRLGRLRFGIEICPNYLVTRDHLEIDEKNLYSAREAVQAVPLWGGEDHERFLAANGWIRSFLPQYDAVVRRPAAQRRRGPWLEKLLSGRLGHMLDRAIHRTLLLYYRLRLWHRGWRRGEIEHAYREDRQALITGGYAGAVARRFAERGREVLEGAGLEISDEELRDAFYGERPNGEVTSYADPHFAALFSDRYGKVSPPQGDKGSPPLNSPQGDKGS